MSQTQEKKDVIGEDSTVIQCPSCLTRFAVESEVVHASEEPRFHCSRCDYVFPLDEANVTVPLSKSGLGESVTIREERNPWAEAGNIATTTTANPVAETDREEPLPAFTPSPKTFEIPNDYRSIVKREPPIEALAIEALATEASAGDHEGQMSFGFSSAPKNQRSYPNPTSPGYYSEPSITRIRSERLDNILEPKPQAFTKDFTIDQSSPITRDSESSSWSEMSRNPFADLSRAEAAAAIPGRRSPGTGHPVLTIAAPLLLFLAVLGGFSYYLHTNPNLLDRIGKAVYARIPETAPPGLYIDRAQLKRVVLDNGETVLVLAGGLVNQTDKAFREVVLEGLAFDGGGQSVIRTRVRADQNLSRTKIHGLSLPLIQEQQNKRGPNRFSMKPGERQQFEFALLSPDANQAALKKARSFSARVYSVQSAS